MYEIHVYQAPEDTTTDEIEIMAFTKSTLDIFRSRGLTPAQAVFKLFGQIPHLRLENPTWASAQCIIFLELQRVFELRSEYENPFLDLPRGH